MKKVYILVLCCFVFTLFQSGCQDIKNIISPKKAAVKPVERQISGPLLAQVNDWRIGLDDFNKRLEALKPFAEQQGLNVQDYDFKSKALNELVRTALLAQEAKARGMGKASDVKEALESYEQTLLAQKLIAESVKNIDVTDVEIENFYNQYKDSFRTPDQVKVREIVLDSEAQAKDLYIQILQGGNFSSLASLYSVAPSKDKGGDLGYLTPDPQTKFQKFWEVAYTLDVGGTSSIFKGDDGKFYIIKLEDKKESKATPLEDIRKDIKDALMIDKENKKVEELVDTAKREAKVVINEDLLK